MSDNIAVMNKGRFEQIGSPQEVYHAPATGFVAGFVGDANKLRARVASVNGAQLLVSNDNGAQMRIDAPQSGLSEGQQVEVFLRPEAVELIADETQARTGANLAPCIVTSVLFNGANSAVTVRDTVSDAVINVALPQAGAFSDLAVGDAVFTQWDADKARCYALAEGDA